MTAIGTDRRMGGTIDVSRRRKRSGPLTALFIDDKELADMPPTATLPPHQNCGGRRAFMMDGQMRCRRCGRGREVEVVS